MKPSGFLITGKSNNAEWGVKFFFHEENAQKYLDDLNTAVDMVLEEYGHITPDKILVELDPNIKGCYNSIKYSLEEVLWE